MAGQKVPTLFAFFEILTYNYSFSSIPAWTDFLILLLIAFYLYQVVRGL